MSNQARLLLLSGTAGSGTTSACAATVEELSLEGLRAVAIDPYDGEAEEVGLAAQVLLGLTTLPPALWWGSGAVAQLTAWQRVGRALADEGTDAVVVDLGDLRRAIEMVDVLDVGRRILEAALTPDLASRSDAVDSPFDVLAGAKEALDAVASALRSDATRMRLVCEPRIHDVERVLEASATLAMLGVDVDGVIVNRCARKSAAPAAAARAQRDLLDLLAEGADGPMVWKATETVRAVPKGRSAMGPLGASRVLREDTLDVSASDDGYSLRMPLAGVSRARARVGRHQDFLVVEFGGVTRWIDLPSVLRRCIAVEARRAADGLVVTFVPDPGQWREDARLEGAS